MIIRLIIPKDSVFLSRRGHKMRRNLHCLAPLEVVQYFVQRWQVEVTFEEARRHLGVETQRPVASPICTEAQPRNRNQHSQEFRESKP